MILKRIQKNVGKIEEVNTYIVQDQGTKETMLIDPAYDIEEIEEMLKAINAKLKYIVLTHCHGDHIGGAEKIKNLFGGKILIHIDDDNGLHDVNINMSVYIGIGEVILDADSRLNDNDLLHIGNMEFKVIHTPGHTRGSICLYQEKEKLLFSGDTLFRGYWGRTDLPTSNFEQIMSSITNKLMKLPDDTIVYPGHGKSTMIKDEKSIYLELKAKTFY